MNIARGHARLPVGHGNRPCRHQVRANTYEDFIERRLSRLTQPRCYECIRRFTRWRGPLTNVFGTGRAVALRFLRLSIQLAS